MPMPIKPIKESESRLHKSRGRILDEKAEQIRHETVGKDDVLLGDEFIIRWNAEGSAISPNNDLATEILGYTLVGHIFRDVKFPHMMEMGSLDNRLHFLWAQPQRTGKTRLITQLLEPICNLSQIGFKLQGIMSGAGAIGGSDTSMKGDLEMHFDTVHYFDEFMTSIHSLKSRGGSPNEILDVLRMAMNYDGRVSKRLSSVSHEYVTRATIIMATTLIDLLDLPQQAIKGGFLGRPLCLFRDISIEEQKDSEQEYCRNARRMDEDVKYAFLRTVKYFEQLIKERKFNMYVEKDWRETLASEIGRLRDGIGMYSAYLRGGSVDKVIKIATIRAIIYESGFAEQLRPAREIEQKLLQTSGSWLDVAFGDLDEGLTLLVALLQESDGLTRYEIKRKASIFRKHNKLLDECLTQACRENVINAKVEGRGRRYYLKDSKQYEREPDEGY